MTASMRKMPMKILCIGDSNTYGYDPRSYLGSRYPAEVRWTDRLEDCEVINCGVNGLKVPRDSFRYAGMINANQPDLVIVMLGTNDLCSGLGAEQIAAQMSSFLDAVLGALGAQDTHGTHDSHSTPGSHNTHGALSTHSTPGSHGTHGTPGAGRSVLLISPPLLQYGEWVLDDDVLYESQDLGELYRQVAEQKGCFFADAGEWNIEMTFDGVHFSPEGHSVFAQKLNETLKQII